MISELLAPAGSELALHSALDAGANAIYFGVSQFSARAKADNFTKDQLGMVSDYCHVRGAKAYLAVNTLVYDYEISDAMETVRQAYIEGIDAVIIQDKGLCSLIRKTFPDFQIHASTQMNVHNMDTLLLAQDMGISRWVLPREFSREDIDVSVKYSKKHNMGTEVFVHGAHCVSCSGICLFSAMNKSGQRSGNRGDCAQPCRERYSISNQTGRVSEGAQFSIKDRSLYRYLYDLVEIGVDSLKIEGRMRSPEYVRTVVSIYRNTLDQIIEQTPANT
ncbi:MAG: U32 family peptidase [Clostridiaceae bacterium]|nr:U32 family peptidase [Clostridiaceae bacterium]